MGWRRSRGWLAWLMLGYALFYGVFLAEMAYSLPQRHNADCVGLAAVWFRRSLALAPVRWFAAGPCQQFPHLGLLLLVTAVALLGFGYLAARWDGKTE